MHECAGRARVNLTPDLQGPCRADSRFGRGRSSGSRRGAVKRDPWVRLGDRKKTPAP
jgi:hypothetical protein